MPETRLTVKVVPGASRSELAGWTGDVLMLELVSAQLAAAVSKEIID